MILIGQQQGAAQLHYHDLLGGRELRLQAVCRVGAVLHALALLPFVDGLPGNAVLLGKRCSRIIAGGDLCTNGWNSRAEAGTALFTWIESWYNPRRLHSVLSYQSPCQYEQQHTAAH